MFGEKRDTLVTKICSECKKAVVVRVDPDDLQRHADGMFVQHAFADRNGIPYLAPELRELWLSGVCGECWTKLCPHDVKAYN